MRGEKAVERRENCNFAVMSKTALKKALAGMDAAQLTELITDLYEARSEAKEYLDFYINPDIDKKMTKAKSLIAKEVGRTSRGRARPRSTRVRRFIKDIESLNPGAEHVAEAMTYTIEQFCLTGSVNWVKESTQRSVGRLVADTVRLADRGGVLSLFLPRIETAIDGMDKSHFHSRDFRNVLKDSLNDALDSLA